MFHGLGEDNMNFKTLAILFALCFLVNGNSESEKKSTSGFNWDFKKIDINSIKFNNLESYSKIDSNGIVFNTGYDFNKNIDERNNKEYHCPISFLDWWIIIDKTTYLEYECIGIISDSLDSIVLAIKFYNLYDNNLFDIGYILKQEEIKSGVYNFNLIYNSKFQIKQIKWSVSRFDKLKPVFDSIKRAFKN